MEVNGLTLIFKSKKNGGRNGVKFYMNRFVLPAVPIIKVKLESSEDP